MHHNAIRQHLAKLTQAGLVVESTMPSTGRGRPRLAYRAHPSAESRWGAIGPYQRLSQLLAEVVRSGDTPIEVGRRSVSDDVGTTPGAAAGLVGLMAHLGFEPRLDTTSPPADDRSNEFVVILESCPFLAALDTTADRDAVCELHLGMAHGVADHYPELSIDGLDRTDPRAANCQLRARVAPAA